MSGREPRHQKCEFVLVLRRKAKGYVVTADDEHEIGYTRYVQYVQNTHAHSQRVSPGGAGRIPGRRGTVHDDFYDSVSKFFVVVRYLEHALHGNQLRECGFNFFLGVEWEDDGV